MSGYWLFMAVVFSFLTTLVLLPFWIRKTRQIGLQWKDMNKSKDIFVAGSGGVVVIVGLIVGLLVFVTYRTFVLQTEEFLIEILTVLGTVLFLAFFGLIDDMFGWQRGGLSVIQKVILSALAAVPLISINAGRSIVSIPFLGITDLGLIYPLVVIPIGIVGATATFNILAGFNGLEAGQGILLLVGTGLVAFFLGNSWLTIVALCAAAALLAFLLFNYYPASVFPGDVLTYPIGGLIAVISILGSFERVAVFFFIPYILEAVLKTRGKIKKQSFGKPLGNGVLGLRYGKLYSLNHVAIYLMQKIGITPTERRAVFLLWAFQIVIILVGFYIFREGIFL